jgi:beta-1,4-mannosyl-glycoprotein beta-1,4-N-acetylglucosaminyltransferase
MAIFDCFTYFNELEVLKIRMAELWDVVDRFVAVEASTTFSGIPKPYLLTERVDQLGHLSEKLSIHRVNDLPAGVNNRWPAEILQRDAIAHALQPLGPAQDDLLLLSDVDEIPSAAAVRQARSMIRADEVVGFATPLHNYRLDLVVYEWSRASTSLLRACRAAMLGPLTAHEIRSMFVAGDRIINNGGWHFSFLSRRGATASAVQQKIGAFAHDEVTAENVEWPRRRRASFTNHYGQLLEPIDGDGLPQVVQDNPSDWAAFREFPDGPSRHDRLAFQAMWITKRAELRLEQARSRFRRPSKRLG